MRRYIEFGNDNDHGNEKSRHGYEMPKMVMR